MSAGKYLLAFAETALGGATLFNKKGKSMRKIIMVLIMVVILGMLAACAGLSDVQRTRPAGNAGHSHMMPTER